MAFRYQQSTGVLTNCKGEVLGTGYSGHGTGLNNPAMDDVEGVGPIPAGHWHIGPAKNPVDHLGPIAMPLTPQGFDPHGRSAFFMHGDNAAADHTASDGCIIMPHNVRQAVDQSSDCDLEVIP